jgi:FdhD protein
MTDRMVATRSITRIERGAAHRRDDAVAVEAALAIRVDDRDLAVTLRTPGADRDLACGFLAGEGIIRTRADIARVVETQAACEDEPDIIDLQLAPGVRLDWSRLERHFAANSACGICGRAHLDSLRAGLTPMPMTPVYDASRLTDLEDRLRSAQPGFGLTGGLHAAALLDASLNLLAGREDVGRHNAVDKVVGWLVGEGRFPADGGLLWASGRAGAEIVLKAARARIPVLAAVGAPSTLSIAIAEAAGLTLIGFCREGRMNVYTGLDRVRGAG